MPDVKVEGDVDVKGPSVDVDVPKADIDLPDVDVKAPSADVDVPSPKTKSKGGFSIKMPGFSLPKFGGKGKGVDVNADVSAPDVDVKGPDVDLPDVKVEGGVDVKASAVDAGVPKTDWNVNRRCFQV